MSNEANTCRKYVEPKLKDAGWERESHTYYEQYYFTDGKIRPKNKRQPRGKRKFVDYLLLYNGEFPLAVVEAKRKHKTPDEGLEQAIDYANLLGVKFAYSTNGQGIVEFDFITGKQSDVMESFPSLDELWRRLTGEAKEQIRGDIAEKLLTPFYPIPDKPLRYYQRNAINAALAAIFKAQNRLLLTMATGTGKTTVAFQIAWKLSSLQWNISGESRSPRILFLADRNILVDDPMNKDFSAFNQERIYKIQGEAKKGRDLYFAIYQAIGDTQYSFGLYREYSSDYFDLIIVDECHRGSARDESNWRQILEHFEPAYQLGLTATPLRDDNVDTYRYFGNPLYTYSLKQGIDDGFLAPYRVYRITTRSDREGWRPNAGQIDRYGRTIPNEVYLTPDFERKLVREARTKAIAQHITDFLRSGDRYAKTIVFCVDEQHVKAMIKELRNLNSDITKTNPDYITRITSDAGDVGKGHLYKFKDVLDETYIIAVTAKLLTTGVDIPTCKNVVLARVIRSMTDFKQIIGRGTRVREERGKRSFNILDYTNSTVLFEDRDFDGEPALINESEIDDDGQILSEHEEELESADLEEETEDLEDDERSGFPGLPDDDDILPRKYYADGGSEEIVEERINDEAILPDGTKGAGLLAYLRHLKSKTGRDRADVIAKVFKDVTNRMISGTLLWDVLSKVNDIHFDKSEEVNLLSTLYESMLKEMRDAAGDSGEFYTPRPVVRFIVQVMEPKLGETIFDPACGTGGFLVEAYEYLKKNCSAQDWQILQKSIIGGEAKSLPLMLAHMSLLLHGFEYPDIDDGNSLRFTLSEMGEKDWVDVILTNPPFGGEEEDRIKNNFPPDRQTKETALLFLQLIMRRLRQRPKPGRAAVVFPNGVLFGDNTCAKLKEDLLKDFNLHTIVRLPNGVFAPYTGIPTNLLFFDRSGQTNEIWYYELPLPEGRKTYTKTKPTQDEDFSECVAWWKNREENAQAYKYNFREAYNQAIKDATPHWDAGKKAEETANKLAKAVKELAEKIPGLQNSILDFSPSKDIAQIKNQIQVVKDEVKQAQTAEQVQREIAKDEKAKGDAIYWSIYNLDRKNPNNQQDFEHLPPEQLVADILEKDRRVAEIMAEIKAILEQ